MRTQHTRSSMRLKDVNKLDFNKMHGLIPAIVQDAADRRVLMLGFMDRTALARTLRERKVTFWSRSRRRYWQKGETSGNIMHVVRVATDCDRDSVLITAEPSGPVCHTGADSCFDPVAYASGSALFLDRLYRLIGERKRKLPAGSYTTTLLAGGLSLLTSKLVEESVETYHAARKESNQRLAEESADLLFHLLVLLAAKNVPLSRVMSILKRRHSSGQRRRK